jgi:adenylosuccinate lyase
LHLQLAKEQFAHAGMLTSKAWSDRLLLRAQVDAELALALARSESEKAEARVAVDKVKKLKETATQSFEGKGNQ